MNTYPRSFTTGYASILRDYFGYIPEMEHKEVIEYRSSTLNEKSSPENGSEYSFILPTKG